MIILYMLIIKRRIAKFLDLLPYIKGLKRDLKSYERWGVPGHFYSPIPSLEEIEKYSNRLFRLPVNELEVIGIDFNVNNQLELLKSFKTIYSEIPYTKEKTGLTRYYFNNQNYSYTDAIMLYSIIRHFKPANIVEIGSGFSSCATLDINELFFSNRINCTFIEPYPELLNSLIRKEDQSENKIIVSKVQETDIEIYTSLNANDILFIDSSHIMKMGSDLQYILFNILPKLKEGVIIHFHDIFYPFEYPKKWITENFYAWNEIYVLRAFLTNNNAMEILIFNHYLTIVHKKWFEENMPLCLNNPGGSLWLRKKK
jgi:hypothetical protein